LVPPIFGAVAIGALAFGVTRFAKEEVKADYVPSTKPTTHPSASASAPVTITSATASAATTAVAIAPTTIKTAAPKVTDRSIVIAHVKPPNGVAIAVDGVQQIVDTQPGSKLTLDLEKHELTFTCRNDGCIPDQKTIAAGDHDDSIDIALKIRPAKLKILGSPGSTYSSSDEPTLAIGMTSDAMVPMSAGQRVFHVTELPSNRTLSAMLTANTETTLDFTKPAASP
jgi:hypothetical protein